MRLHPPPALPLQSVAERMHRVVAALAGRAAIVENEAEFSVVVRQLFDAAGLVYEAEVKLPLEKPRAVKGDASERFECESLGGLSFELRDRSKGPDRIDFVVDRIGVELKVDGGFAEVLRQLGRYARHDSIDGLVLVSTRRRLAGMPGELLGKPLVTVIMGSL